VHLISGRMTGFARRFQDLLRRHRFDVVHSHLHYASGYFLRLAAECGIPIRVAHFRSSTEQHARTLPRRLAAWLLSPFVDRFASQATMRRWLDRHATRVLGVSQWALTRAWNPHWTSDPRCQVVYDGLEPWAFDRKPDPEGVRREFGLPKDATLCIHVGRITEAKNHLRLVSIFSKLLDRQPEARLLLVGRNLEGRNGNRIERRLRRRIADLKIGDAVVFAGQRSDVPRLMKAADLFVFPSLWEGLGDVVLEACAAGTPALCSDLPSIREIASRLPAVRCLSLDQPDVEWARLAQHIANRPVSEPDRQAALETFAGSEFTVQRCAQALCRIWQGCTAAPQQIGVADA
jgi:glycosyltransferase involved in cell wall biosynthesis